VLQVHLPKNKEAKAEGCSFDVRDVESLREHYARTLRLWLTRLEARQAEAVVQVGEEAYRGWRLYLAGSAHGFQRGHLSIYQTLLAKTDDYGTAKVPLTRKNGYVQKEGSKAITFDHDIGPHSYPLLFGSGVFDHKLDLGYGQRTG